MSVASIPRFDNDSRSSAVFWILRIGIVACLVGHGALGISSVASWTSYFGVVGIGPERALTLMPWVGVFDVMMAVTLLFYPNRAVVAYLVVWTLWTALLRPLAGESFWEAIERAGNYGVPLAFLLLFAEGHGTKAWFGNRFRATLDEPHLRLIGWILRLTTVLLLLGHGALNAVVEKPMFNAQYSMIGLPGATATSLVGLFEGLLALAVLLKPSRWLLFTVVGWKVASEALCPMAGSPLWVFVEHGGSYAAPLALAYLLPHFNPIPSRTTAATAAVH